MQSVQNATEFNPDLLEAMVDKILVYQDGKQRRVEIVFKYKQDFSALQSAYEKYSDGKISRDDFLSLKDQLSGELVKLNEEKEAIERELAAMESADDTELAAFGKEAGQFLKAYEITNEMLLFFIESVKVYSGMRIEIKYRFSDEITKLLAD